MRSFSYSCVGDQLLDFSLQDLRDVVKDFLGESFSENEEEEEYYTGIIV